MPTIKHLFILLVALCSFFSCSIKNNVSFSDIPSGNAIVSSQSLSNQNVNVILEDSKGFMWIGTDVGLNRYDGSEYLQFYSTDDSLSLNHSKVYTIFEDSRHDIWVGTRGGINRLRNDFRWDRFKLNSLSTNIFDFCENSKGEIFASNRWSCLKYESDTAGFKEVLNYMDYSILFSKPFLDSKDDIWLVKDHEIVQYDGSTFDRLRSFDVNEAVVGAIIDDNDCIWMIHADEISIFDTKRYCFAPAPETFEAVRHKDNAVWTNIYKTIGGFSLVDSNNSLSFYSFSNGILSPDMNYTAAKINYIFQDSRRNYWFGFNNRGYSYINISNHLSQGEVNLQNRLSGKSVNFLGKDVGGNLWTLSDMTDIMKLDVSSVEVSEIHPASFIKAAASGSANIDYIIPDRLRNNILWVLSSSILYECEVKGEDLIKLHSYKADSGIMHALFQDKEGNVYMYGMGTDLYIVHPDGSERPFQIYNIALTNITDMLQLSDGSVVFCANYRNIFSLNFETDTTDLLVTIPQKNYEPTCMFQDSDGKVWVTSNGWMIRQFTPGAGDWLEIDFDASSFNNSILEDGQYMWIGSQNGLYKYNKSTGIYSVFYSGDGIIGNQFNPHAACKLDSGELVFGGTGGITIFNPNLESEIGDDLPLEIEKVTTASGEYISDPDVEMQVIRLKPTDRDVTFRYSALDFNEYLHVRYEYQMKGVDSEWHYVHNQKEAHYVHLPYGHHVFTVRVVGAARVETGVERSLDIFIRRPLFLSTFAKLCYLLILILCVYEVFLFQKKIHNKDMETKLAMREKEQQRVMNEKNIDFFTNISHEFRTPLTMILGASDMVRKNEVESTGEDKYSRILIRNTRRMQRLVDQLLDMNKLENNSLHLHVKKEDFNSHIKDVVDSFQFFVSSKGISLTYESSEDTIFGCLDEDVMEKMLYNLISNAVKYTPVGGTIMVKSEVLPFEDVATRFTVPNDDRYVRITVEDSGIGIPEDKRDVIFNKFYQIETNKSIGGTGIGLYFTKMLSRLHHGDIVCDGRTSSDGSELPGSKFMFVIPLSESSYTVEERTPREKIPESHLMKPVLSEYTVDKSQTDDLTQKPVALCIDDDVDVLQFLKTALSSEFKVIARFDATSGYDSISQVKPDIIISDVLMLDMDGFEFCRMVKDNEEYSNIPVILLTAKTSSEDQIKGLEAHSDAYVTKPFETSYLIALMHTLIEKRNAAKEVVSSTTLNTRSRLDDIVKEKDRIFLEEVYKFMEEELANEELNVTAIYEKMYMSRTNFYNKIKSLTGETPGNFFRTYKLNRAKEMLDSGQYKIAAVAIMTGFCSASHFSTLFKKQFGMTPTEYISESASQ